MDYTITINRAINSAVVFASPSLRMPVSIAHFFHQLVHFLAMCLCILRGRGLKKFWQIYFIASLLENRLKCTPNAVRQQPLIVERVLLIDKQPRRSKIQWRRSTITSCGMRIFDTVDDQRFL